MIGDLAEDDPEARDSQRLLAAFAPAEIERIIGKHGVRVPLTP